MDDAKKPETRNVPAPRPAPGPDPAQPVMDPNAVQVTAEMLKDWAGADIVDKIMSIRVLQSKVAELTKENTQLKAKLAALVKKPTDPPPAAPTPEPLKEEGTDAK